MNARGPNYRCVTYGSGAVVEIPHDWYAPRWWPGGIVDPALARAIRRLIETQGTGGPIYAEGSPS